MPARIFISYRRDDVAGDARGIRDGLAARFGRGSVFMDVDDLLAGQRFDEELAKALDACDVLIAVVGPRWMDLLRVKIASGELDYVRAEIDGALRRRIVVIPVRVGREGQMPPLPRPEVLPDDLRDLVLHQKHDVAHERFGRDMADLAEAIAAIRRIRRAEQGIGVSWRRAGAAALALVAVVGAGVYIAGVANPKIKPAEPVKPVTEATTKKADPEAQAKVQAEHRLGALTKTAPAEKKEGSPDAPSAVMFVVDASGSMAGIIESSARQSKFSIVREVLAAGLGQLRPQVRVGLTIFGHRRGACSDVEVVRSPEPLDVERIVASLADVRPRGRGPLTLALREAAKSLPRDAKRRSLVLLHDGVDNCGQDVCVAAAELATEGITAHVIGLGVIVDDMAKMACLPKMTGGRHLNAQSLEQVSPALDEVTSLLADARAASK